MTAKYIPENIPVMEFTDSQQLKLFGSLKKYQVSGRVLMTSPQGQQWIFYLYQGKIIYATGGIHSVRRWQRQIKACLPQISLADDLYTLTPKNIEVCWEYDSLCSWVEQGIITREQAQTTILSIINEILFDLTQGMEIVCEIQRNHSFSVKLEEIDIELLIAKTARLWKAWQDSRIADRNPNTAPIILKAEQLKQTSSSQLYQNLCQLLDGEKTLRDIAILINKSSLQLTRSLLPLIQSGVIKLVDIPDLPEPSYFTIAEAPLSPLVACIDDSPTICYMMEQVISIAGYRFVAINDALKATIVLLENKPDLILLDLVMPNLSGYELCHHLRQHPSLRDIPILFLTSHDGVFDRVRAKMTGCNGFLSKTIDPDKLLLAIRQHLEG